jgi:hypothetical protein
MLKVLVFLCSCDRGSVAVPGYVAVGEFVHEGMP